MAKAASLVLATVNAPYGANLSAHQLAALIADPKSASDFNAPVFSFFSEVTRLCNCSSSRKWVSMPIRSARSLASSHISRATRFRWPPEAIGLGDAITLA